MCRFASLTSDASFRSLKCGFTALLRSDNQSSEKEMVDSESMSPLNIEASQNWPVDTRNLVDSTQALSFASQRERRWVDFARHVVLQRPGEPDCQASNQG